MGWTQDFHPGMQICHSFWPMGKNNALISVQLAVLRRNLYQTGWAAKKLRFWEEGGGPVCDNDDDHGNTTPTGGSAQLKRHKAMKQGAYQRRGRRQILAQAEKRKGCWDFKTFIQKGGGESRVYDRPEARPKNKRCEVVRTESVTLLLPQFRWQLCSSCIWSCANSIFSFPTWDQIWYEPFLEQHAK